MSLKEVNINQPPVPLANPSRARSPIELSTDTQLVQRPFSKRVSGIAPSSWVSHKGYEPLGSPPKFTVSSSVDGDEVREDEAEVDMTFEQTYDAQETLDSCLSECNSTANDGSSTIQDDLSQSAITSPLGTGAEALQASVQGPHLVPDLSSLHVDRNREKDVLSSPAKFSQETEPVHDDWPNAHTKIFETSLGSLLSLPDQRKRIAHRSGVSFTLMVAGESGSGKSTFVQMLLGESAKGSRQISKYPHSHSLGTSSGLAKPSSVHRTTDIEIHWCTVEENGFEAHFTVVDTPGFGDYTNNLYAWVPITNYIDSQNQLYMCEEEQPNRNRLTDNRVHVCLYFLQPSGHSLLPLDITAMKEIGGRVNLVPVISKSDSQTVEEVAQFKQIVRESVAQHNIPIFDIDEESSDWPYALVSSTDVVRSSDGRDVYGRRYDWGTVEVENPLHSDLARLKRVLMGKHMLTLIDTTHEYHYKKQRREMRLLRLSKSLKTGNEPTPVAQSASFLTPKANQGPVKGALFSGAAPSQSILKSPAGAGKARPLPKTASFEDVARSMTGLEILTAVSPFGFRYLEEQRVEEDLLYKQRVHGITNQFSTVLKFQQQRFEEKASALEQKRQEFEAEIAELSATNEQLEQRIAEIEASANNLRRKR